MPAWTCPLSSTGASAPTQPAYCTTRHDRIVCDSFVPRPNAETAVAVRVHPLKLTAVVAYLIVTVRLAVSRDPTLVIQPRASRVRSPARVGDHRIPRAGRANGQSESRRAAGPITLTRSRPWPGEGLVYNTAGSVCGFPEKPKVDVAAYRLRLPWSSCHLPGRGSSCVMRRRPRAATAKVERHCGPNQRDHHDRCIRRDGAPSVQDAAPNVDRHRIPRTEATLDG